MRADKVMSYVYRAALLVGAIGMLASCNAIQVARTGGTTVAKLESEAIEIFKPWDAAHQMEILHETTIRAEYEEKIGAYRKAREAVVKAANGFYIGLVAFEKSVALAEAGLQKKATLALALKELWDGFEKVKAAMVALGVPLGGI